MADEPWGTMPTDLQSLRVEVSVNNNMQTLENLCLVKVADTLDFHCNARKQQGRLRRLLELLMGKTSASVEFPLQYYEPFKYLTPILMGSLQRILEERRSAFTPLVLLCLVGRNTRRLVADMSDHGYLWSKKQKEALMQRIRDLGQNISELTLVAWGDPVSPALLPGMLGGLTRLTSLKIQGDNNDSSILATIGSCCPELRNLTLSTRDMTDEDLRYLYDSDLPPGTNRKQYGRCKKLTHFVVGSCDVTVDGLVALLSNLPQLLYLKSRYLYEAVAKFTESNEAQLKLQYLFLQDNIGGELESVICKIPDIRKLEIANNKLQNVDELLKLDHITDLSMYCIPECSSLQITTLITNFSHQLTKFSLAFFDYKVDISIIGFYCLQLKELNWRVSCIIDTKHELNPSIHFTKLKKAELDPCRNNDYIFPIDVMKCILASPCLEYFNCARYIIFDFTLSWLLEEARSYGVVFSNLRDLYLPENVFSFWVKQIVCVAPKLKSLYLSKHVGNLVEQFMMQYNLNHCCVTY